MPKMKTNRGAAKRFRATGSGKVRRSKAFSSHILTKKSTKRKRKLRKRTLIDGANLKAVRRMLDQIAVHRHGFLHKRQLDRADLKTIHSDIIHTLYILHSLQDN